MGVLGPTATAAIIALIRSGAVPRPPLMQHAMDSAFEPKPPKISAGEMARKLAPVAPT